MQAFIEQEDCSPSEIQHVLKRAYNENTGKRFMIKYIVCDSSIAFIASWHSLRVVALILYHCGPLRPSQAYVVHLQHDSTCI
jgi:hypothetical protein